MKVSESKYAFPEIWIPEVGTPNLKIIFRFCTWRLYSIHRYIVLTYSTDVGGIVLDELKTSEMGTESLGKSVGVLSTQVSQDNYLECTGLEGSV